MQMRYLPIDSGFIVNFQNKSGSENHSIKVQFFMVQFHSEY